MDKKVTKNVQKKTPVKKTITKKTTPVKTTTVQKMKVKPGVAQEYDEKIVDDNKKPVGNKNKTKNKKVEKEIDYEANSSGGVVAHKAIENLSDLDLAHLELKKQQIDVIKKDLESLELKKQINEIQKSLLETKLEVIERDRIILSYQTQVLGEKIESRKRNNAGFIEELTKKYEIPSHNWGYNPESGKIIYN